MVPIYLVLFLINLPNCFTDNLEGKPCTLNNTETEGICKSIESCPFIIDDIQNERPYTICGYDKTVLIVCCTPKLPMTTEAPTSRISERKCDEYKEAVYEYVESVSIFRDDEETYKRQIDKCGIRNLTIDLSYGEYSSGREFPHMASLGFVSPKNEITWICAGSLISDQYVLTVAHCLDVRYYGHLKYVRLGELNFDSDFDEAQPENFEVAEIISHPYYTPNSPRNDIALIKLNQSVKLNPYKRPACLPAIDESPAQYAIATGWGKSENDGIVSSHLVKVTLEKFSFDKCLVHYAAIGNGISKETQICYGSEDGRNTCPGDSGGPLQVVHSKTYCMYTIIGITSFGSGCGTKGVPGIFTKVPEYIDWIESVVWKEN